MLFGRPGFLGNEGAAAGLRAALRERPPKRPREGQKTNPQPGLSWKIGKKYLKTLVYLKFSYYTCLESSKLMI